MSILLCADSPTIRNPQILGVQECSFDESSFIACNRGEEARNLVKERQDLNEVWISGLDNIDALNLGAAIKRDREGLMVRVIANDKTGSTISKAERAGIDSVISTEEFAALYYKTLNSQKQNKCHFASTLNKSTPIAPHINDKEDKRPTSTNTNCWTGCIVGTNGGCGKSSVAAIYASLVSALEKRTLLIDADYLFGDIRRVIKGAESASISEVLQSRDFLEKLSEKSTGGIPGIIYASEEIEIAEEERNHIVEIIRQAKGFFDCIVINTSSAIDETLIDVMNECCANFLILDQRSSCIQNVSKIRKLAEKVNISEQTFNYCLNRCSKTAVFRPSDISCALGVDHIYQLDDGGEGVEELLSAGEMLTLLEEKNAFAISVFEMICKTFPPCVPGKSGKRNKRDK